LLCHRIGTTAAVGRIHGGEGGVSETAKLSVHLLLGESPRTYLNESRRRGYPVQHPKDSIQDMPTRPDSNETRGKQRSKNREGTRVPKVRKKEREHRLPHSRLREGRPKKEKASAR